jgi:hypothetical protein
MIFIGPLNTTETFLECNIRLVQQAVVEFGYEVVARWDEAYRVQLLFERVDKQRRSVVLTFPAIFSGKVTANISNGSILFEFNVLMPGQMELLRQFVRGL